MAKRRALEAQLSFQAFHDPLTGLTNRRRFMEATATALAERSKPGSVAALFLDLDDFKTINDTLGHGAGDEALIAVSNRLRSALRGSDLAARLGGDEFGVLLRDIPDEARAIEVAERLLAALNEPLPDRGRVGRSRREHRHRASTRRRWRPWTTCSATPTSRCTGQRRRARVATTSSSETDPAARAARDQTWVERGPTVRRREPLRLDRTAPGTSGRLDSSERHPGAVRSISRSANTSPMEIPLFPLHTVLCPGIVVPLHIFEERYRALTRHCLETGAPFGIVLIRDGHEVGAGRHARPLAWARSSRSARPAATRMAGIDLLAAATGRFAIDSVDLARAPYHGGRRDAARGRGR